MDEKARELIQNDLDTTYLVEAGAGTGKTTLLVARILNLLKTGRARFPQIVAITFTEKAAEELKTRIKKQLLSHINSEQNTNILNRLRWAHAEIEKSNINTIHGFCSSILRLFPLEAGILPGFTVFDPGELQKFVREIWSDWLTKQIEQENKTLFSLLLMGISLDKIEKIAKLFIFNRDIIDFKDFLTTSEIDLEKFRNYFSEKITRLRQCRHDCIDNEDKGFLFTNELINNWEILENQSDEQFIFSLFSGISVRSGGNQKNWNPSESLKEVKSILKDLKSETENMRLSYSHNLACETLHWMIEFLKFFEQKKHHAGIIDFDDLLSHTRNLLAHNLEIREQCQKTFSHIFVDEFQDTNTIQVEILFFLARKENDNLPWQQTPLYPGKLFMVGDPKQSIYRFRGADIEIYETVKDTLGSKHCLFITRNFRSAHNIIHWCNQLFTKLIQRPMDGKYQPEYVPLHPSRVEHNFFSINNIMFISSKDKLSTSLNQNELIQMESKYIATTIRKIIDEQWTIYKDGNPEICQYKDIAILFRRYTYVDLFENILSSSGIPYQVMGGKSSYSRIEIKSLSCLLKALMNPDDKVSLLAILRSPIFCISDNTIFEHIALYSQLNYLEIPEGTDDHLSKILYILQNLHQQINIIPGYIWLQDVYQKTGLLMTFASMQQGAQQTNNLKKILQIAKTKKIDDFLKLRNFIEWLGEIESFEDDTTQEHLNAIRIFSIHKSKGLEFGVVILADMTANITNLPEIIMDNESNQIALRFQNQLETKNYQEMVEKEKKRLVAEEKRLLYVALTRARDYLLIPTLGKTQGFLEFLEEELISQAKDIKVDFFTPTVGQISLSSTLPTKIIDIPLTLESKWFSHRQRWIHQQKKKQNSQKDQILDLNKAVHIDPCIQKFICTQIEKITNVGDLPSFSLNDAPIHLQKIIPQEKCYQYLYDIAKNLYNTTKVYYLLPITLKINQRIIQGTIDIAFQNQTGFNIIFSSLIEKNQDDNYYQDWATIYAYMLSQWINCNLNQISIFFLKTSESIVIKNFSLEYMQDNIFLHP